MAQRLCAAGDLKEVLLLRPAPDAGPVAPLRHGSEGDASQQVPREWREGRRDGWGAEEERENGIRITNVFPGEVNTPILDQRPVPPPPEHRAQILQPEDIARTVLLLAELPARAHVPELIIKPTSQGYV